MKNKAAVVEAVPEPAKSSIAGHHAWREVEGFLGTDGRGALPKRLAVHAECEAAERLIGSGPDVRQQHIRAAADLESVANEVRRYTQAHLPVPAEIEARLDAAEDAEQAARAALAARFQLLDEAQAKTREAHAAVLAALAGAFRSRFEILATKALGLYHAAPLAAQKYGRRLPDEVLDVLREVRLGNDLASLFGELGTGEAIFWKGLPLEARTAFAGKLNAGRSHGASAAAPAPVQCLEAANGVH